MQNINLNKLPNSNIIELFKNTTEEFTEKMIRAKELSMIFIDTSQATYDNWFKAGLINRYKIGGSVFYKLSEVIELIEKSREKRKEV